MISPVYLIVPGLCGIAILGLIVLAICDAAKHSDEEILEQVKAEHREACEQQSTAQVDDFFEVVEDIRAECLEAEVGSVEWLEDLFMRRPEKVR